MRAYVLLCCVSVARKKFRLRRQVMRFDRREGTFDHLTSSVIRCVRTQFDHFLIHGEDLTDYPTRVKGVHEKHCRFRAQAVLTPAYRLAMRSPLHQS